MEMVDCISMTHFLRVFDNDSHDDRLQISRSYAVPQTTQRVCTPVKLNIDTSAELWDLCVQNPRKKPPTAAHLPLHEQQSQPSAGRFKVLINKPFSTCHTNSQPAAIYHKGENHSVRCALYSFHLYSWLGKTSSINTLKTAKARETNKITLSRQSLFTLPNGETISAIIAKCNKPQSHRSHN